MKNETLKQIISQIKKYKLTESFSDVEKFEKWASNLNNNQINNFLSLDINLEEIRELRHLLINNDLLNCNDYKQKVAAISTLKNGEGCWHLYDALCKPNFLKSKNFYKDIEMLSKADTARYGLWILGEDAFINSPYHDEDLKLIVEAHDTNKEKSLDYKVSDALATVAGNIDSIKSPYHQADMQLIATAGSDCLQMSHTYPEHSLNALAINKVSLSDKYHLENMQILATKPIASEFLYVVMTNPRIIKGENYRKEVEALLNAKSKLTARALYYYIVNPRKKFDNDFNFHKDYRYDVEKAKLVHSEYDYSKDEIDYINNLIKINKIDDYFVMHLVSLLMNQTFVNSLYKNFDLELLQSVSNKQIFMDLYKLMTNKDSLSGIHHKKDAVIISQATNDEVRNLLLDKACDKYSIKSNDHEYDMQFISELNLDSISEEIYDEMYYYLFVANGMSDPQRKEKLEKLLQGFLVERSTSVSRYLDSLEQQIDNNNGNEQQIIESVNNKVSKPKSRILRLFKK